MSPSRTHAANLEVFRNRMRESRETESGGILDWMKDHPIGSTVAGLVLGAGGLALGHRTGVFQKEWFMKYLPWLEKAGSWISTQAVKLFTALMEKLGIKGATNVADGLASGLDPRLTLRPPRGVSPPRP